MPSQLYSRDLFMVAAANHLLQPRDQALSNEDKNPLVVNNIAYWELNIVKKFLLHEIADEALYASLTQDLPSIPIL